MELEQRVKTLEYEMKILKNEVQRTLLDIQEQVLVHYYPALRAEESKPSEGTIQAIEALRARQPGASVTPTMSAAAAPPAAPAPVTAAQPKRSVAPSPITFAEPKASAAPVAPKEPAASAPPPPSAVPELKKVSLEEIRAAQAELAAESPQSNPITVDKLIAWAKKPDSRANAGESGNTTTLAERGSLKLLEWLMNSASKVNGERDEKRVSEVLDQLTKLNSLVDRASNMEEALRMIEEAKLG